MLSAWGHIIPRYPGPDVVPLARIPAPPLLAEDDPLDLRVHACLGAYRTALRHVYGWCVAVPDPPTRSAMMPPPEVLRAARVLAERRRPPLAWCMFSAHVWMSYHATRQQPPLRWVFGLTRMTTQEGWYAYERAKLNIGRVMLVPAQRELITRYESMRLDLLALASPSESQVRTVVSAAYPGKLYSSLVDVACRQVEQRVEDMQLRVDLGEYIW